MKSKALAVHRVSPLGRLVSILLAASLMIVLMTVSAVRAQDVVSPADRSSIQNIISSQMEAFKRDDGGTAFSFASPSIQTMFGSADIFMEMVKNGYPQVYRPNSAAFIGMESNSGRIMQKVLITGPNGDTVMALYFMEQQPDGTWRIDGVQLVKPPGGLV